jgi:hypothetical protein
VVAAQQPLRLRDLLRRDRLPALEQQRAADDVRPRRGVQLVGEAEEEVVLPRIVQVEDVAGDDADFADARAGRLELGERGEGLRLLRTGRAGCPGQGREPNEQAIPN